jgi:RNA polymerase sigma-70 factor, ECF subfamily
MTALGNSFDWLNEHGDYLYRYALARLRDPHMAEDVVQETLLAAMQSSGFTGKSSVRTWLTGILKHKIIDLFRRQQRETPLDGQYEISDDPSDMGEFFLDDGHWLEPPKTWGEPDSLMQQDQSFTNTPGLSRSPTKEIGKNFLVTRC